MNKDLSNVIEYLVCCIGAFAERFSLTNGQSYSYLHQYKGLDFLVRHYDVEHTLSIDDAVDDVFNICKRHGGEIAL